MAKPFSITPKVHVYSRSFKFLSFFKKRRASLITVTAKAAPLPNKSLFFSLAASGFFSQKILSYFLGFFIRNGLLANHLKSLYFIFNRSLSYEQKGTLAPLSFNFFPTPLNLIAALSGLRTSSEYAPVPESFTPFSFFFKTIASSLALTYRVVFVGLSRRLRKIVKNKYRFRRQYVCVFPASRLRYGFHLIKFCLKFMGGKTKTDRLLTLITSLGVNYTTSPIYQLRYQQQKHVLGALRKQYLLS